MSWNIVSLIFAWLKHCESVMIMVKYNKMFIFYDILLKMVVLTILIVNDVIYKWLILQWVIYCINISKGKGKEWCELNNVSGKFWNSKIPHWQHVVNENSVACEKHGNIEVF